MVWNHRDVGTRTSERVFRKQDWKELSEVCVLTVYAEWKTVRFLDSSKTC